MGSFFRWMLYGADVLKDGAYVAGSGGVVGAFNWAAGMAPAFFGISATTLGVGLLGGALAIGGAYYYLTRPTEVAGRDDADTRAVADDRKELAAATTAAAAAAASPTATPEEKAAAAARVEEVAGRIEDRRKTGRVEGEPIRTGFIAPAEDGFSVFVANNDVFVGRRSVIESAPCASVILWGTRPETVASVATVKNALQDDHGRPLTFSTPAEAMQAYETMKVSIKRAHPAFPSHGKLGEFRGESFRVGPFSVRVDTSVLAPGHWYAVNNVDRLVMR